MASEIIWKPSAEDIQENLRNGKVMLVSVNSATIFTGNSHIMAIVDINTDGQIYISNPNSNTYNGWADVSEIMKGCDYIVVTDAKASGIAPVETTTTGFVAVVATWNQTDTTLESNDPNVNSYGTTSQYSMTTTTVNYRGMVDRYAMPFNFLWALLVCGQEKEFVFELADLVYNSDIQVTIYDNLTVNTNINEWNYNQECKTQVDIGIEGSFLDSFGSGHIIKNHEDLETYHYTTKKTVVTHTNTINQVLTRADTWIVDYKNEYIYSEPTTTSSLNTITYDDQTFPTEPDSVGNQHNCEYIETLKRQIISEISAKIDSANEGKDEYSKLIFAPSLVQFNENYSTRTYNRYANIYDNTTNITETKKFTEGTPDVKEKTSTELDENDEPKELNFVTIYRKAEHMKARKNINSITEWLFDIVEENGKPDVDLVRYLLYKATGKNYGIKEYDFSEFDASKFKDGYGIYGGTAQEKVWFALKDLGYSDISAAGVMGNLDYESGGFNPSAIEGGNGIGIGLAQWSYSRREQLESYAKSKGKECTDVNIQVEFLITELTGEGPAAGFAEYQFMSNNGYSYNSFKDAKSVEESTKAFCWTFERPNESDGNNSMSERISRARKYLNECPNWKRSNGSDILSVCEEVMNDMIARNVHYSLQNLKWGNIEEASKHSHVCCATYVSIVLYKSGYLTETQINSYNYNWTGQGGIPDMLKAAGWSKVSHSDIQPGDVINNYGKHVLIYAGDGKVYDQSCGVVSSSGNPPKGAAYSGWSRYSGNSNVEVWRAPNK